MAVQPGFGILVRQPGGDGSPVATAKEIAIPKITALLASRFHRGPVSFGFHDEPLPGNPPADKAAAQGGSCMARTERQDEEFAALRTALAEKEKVLEDSASLQVIGSARMVRTQIVQEEFMSCMYESFCYPRCLRQA